MSEQGITVRQPVDSLTTYAEMEKAASAMAAAKLFGLQTKEQVLAMGLLAQSEGRPFASAVRDFDLVQGRPALKSQACLARFQQAGGVIEWVERTDKKVTATFIHPQVKGSLTVTWDIARATTAGLAGKDLWKKYPAQMMASRVVAEGVRAVFPACLSGLYLVEEVQDFDPKDISADVQATPPPSAIADAKAKVAKAAPKPKSATPPATILEPTAPAKDETPWKTKLIMAFDQKFNLKLADLEAWKGKKEKDWTEDDRKQFLADYKDPDFDADAIKVYIEKLRGEAAGEPQPGEEPATAFEQPEPHAERWP